MRQEEIPRNALIPNGEDRVVTPTPLPRHRETATKDNDITMVDDTTLTPVEEEDIHLVLTAINNEEAELIIKAD